MSNLFSLSLFNSAKKIVRSELAKNSLIFTVANSLKAAIPLLLLPILTKYLTPSDYAIVEILQISISVSMVLVGLNTHGSININYFLFEKNKFKDFVGNIFIILLASFLLICLLTLVVKNYLGDLLDVSSGWIFVVVIIGFFQFIITSNLVLWQSAKKAIPYGILQIAQTVVNILFSLFFVIGLSLNWQGRVLAILFSTIIISLVSLFIIYKKGYLSVRIRKELIFDALKFGVPLIPHALSTWIISYIDRFFIIYLVGLSAAGLYSAGYQIGLIIGLLATSFNKAWVPFFYELLKEKTIQSKLKIVKMTYLYFLAINLVALLISLTSPWIIKTFLSVDYYNSIQFVPWIAFGYAFMGMYFMVTNYIFYAKKTYILSITTGSSAILNIILNFFFISKWGSVGAAQATLLTNFIFFIIVWIVGSRIYKMPWLSFWRVNYQNKSL